MTRHDLKQATLGQLLDQAIAAHPDNDAVVYADRDFRLTYREFGDVVDRLAKGLMALGVQKNEKVAVWATNVPYWVALQFATAKIGAILLTVNTNYKTAELDYLLRQSETENIFIIDGLRDTDYVQTLYELVPELKTQERGFLKSEAFPHLKRVAFLGPEKHRGMYAIPEIMALSVMTDDDAYRSRQASLDPHDVVNMQYTSGTTGFPKGVMLTHHNIGTNGYWIGRKPELHPRRPRLHPGAALSLLRVRAGGAGGRHPRRHHGAAGNLRSGGRDGLGGGGTLHGPLRRAHYVHRHAPAQAVQEVRLRIAAGPASWPVRLVPSKSCARSSTR